MRVASVGLQIEKLEFGCSFVWSSVGRKERDGLVSFRGNIGQTMVGYLCSNGSCERAISTVAGFIGRTLCCGRSASEKLIPSAFLIGDSFSE